MEELFIEARYTGEIDFSGIDTKALPKKVALFTTVQYLDFLPKLVQHLKKCRKEVLLYKPLHARYAGQILGCSGAYFKDAEAFLYMGDGNFHPTALAIKNNKPVFVFDPQSGSFHKLPKTEADRFEKQRKLGLLKFHSSDEIGLLVSTKPGQGNLHIAERIRKKYPQKSFYILLFDTLDFVQLSNFPFVQSFVNTACKRLSYDDSSSFPRPVVDAEEII
jgi:2-(3-amino-3-carboxypropyl)histidine synthase